MAKWIYLQRKAHCYPAPMVRTIGKVFTKSGAVAMAGKTFETIAATYVDGIMTWYGMKERIDILEKKTSELVLKNPEYLQKWKNNLIKKCKTLLDFTSTFEKMDFDKLTKEELWQLYDKFLNLYEDAYIWGEPIAWLTKDTITDELREYLKGILKEEKNLDHYLHVMITPTFKSFVVREEEDMLKIALKPKKDQDKLLEKHTKEYCWIPYDYGVIMWDKRHFENSLKNVIKKKDSKKEIEKINEHLENIKKEQERIIKELNIDKHHQKIFEAVRICIFLMDYKKEHLTKSHCHMRRLLLAIAKRLGINFIQVQSLKVEETEEALIKNKLLDKKRLDKRLDFSIVTWHKGDMEILEGEEAHKFYDENLKKEFDAEIKELTGKPASVGRYVGRVCVVTDANNIGKVEQGDVLVTMMTSPDYTIGMKKAGAIVTDEGGMTCHAAIVSRELKIPCIVGTGKATIALKDGDIVEVDADKGAVKVLKRK